MEIGLVFLRGEHVHLEDTEWSLPESVASTETDWLPDSNMQ